MLRPLRTYKRALARSSYDIGNHLNLNLQYSLLHRLGYATDASSEATPQSTSEKPAKKTRTLVRFEDLPSGLTLPDGTIAPPLGEWEPSSACE